MELVLSICLLASPGVCKDESLSMSQEQPALSSSCIMAAPILIAEWCETHPKWKVIKWRCGQISESSKNI